MIILWCDFCSHLQSKIKGVLAFYSSIPQEGCTVSHPWLLSRHCLVDGPFREYSLSQVYVITEPLLTYTPLAK